jgi:hypothetical protein
MAGISIACSSCEASLKLPDASLIGKRVKCPKCGNRFVLALPQAPALDPEEVPLQLVDPAVPTAAPVLGTSARWVPDAPSPVFPLTPLVQPTAANGGFDASVFQGNFPSNSPPEIAVAPFGVAGLDANASAETGSVISRVKGRRKKSLNKSMLVGIAVLCFSVIGGGIWFMLQASVEVPQPKIQPNPEYQAVVAERAASNDDAKTLSPTSGEPIPIDYLPFTPQVLCHMHPAELWKDDRNTAELHAMLSTLDIWLKEQIKTRTRFEPEEISELTFAINFGARMSAPDVAAVVRLKSSQTDQEFMKRFKGRIYDDPKVELYEAADFSYLKIDDKTFVLAPSNMSESLAMALKDPALLLSDMEPLVEQSDRDRHLSLLFDLKILDSHREDAFMSQMQMLADKFLFWFGEDVQTVSWSMHLEPNLYMETLLHQTQASTPVKLQRVTQVKLSNLPEEILQGVRMMRPTTIGSREMIGRFPAMIKALEIGTTAHIDPTGVRLVTLLPQNASANLAAGAMLTWNQSLLTNFEDASHLTKADTTKVPDKVADRLKMNVLIDFRRTPLQEAFSYIGDSIKTEITIDGDGLKAAAFTQNMPQTFDLGNVTALKAIDTIFAQYAKERDPMVMVVDETTKKIVVSTVSKAKADGLTPYDTKQ